MYRILLVDDEPRQLRAMSAIIQGLRPGYAVTTATDGREALDLAGQEGFHAVITDIRMPVMDGLELLDHLAKRQYPAKFILLSGYGEFAYAQQAIRIGIFDYLIKPIGRQDIAQLLDKIDAALEQDSRNSKRIDELARQLDHSLPAYREKRLRDWLLGHSDPQEVRAMLETEWNGEQGFVVAARFSYGRPHQEGWKTPPAAFYRSALEDRLRQLGPFRPMSVDGGEGLVLSLILCRNMTSALWRKAADAIQDVLGDCVTEYGVALSAGCSLLSERIWSSGREACRQAEEALGRRFFEGGGKVIVYRNGDPETEAPDLFEGEEQLAEAVAEGHEEASNEWINRLFERIASSRSLLPQQIKHDVTKLLLDRLRETRHLLTEEEYRTWGDEMKRKLTSCEDYRELRHWAKKSLHPILERCRRSALDKNGILIQKCKEWIREEFPHQDITLEAIAGRYHFNPSYFSTLFKSYTGISLTDYIIQVRMDAAERLLLETDDRISDIARKVGYKEAGYFIRLFRREKGTSPKKYRSLNGKG